MKSIFACEDDVSDEGDVLREGDVLALAAAVALGDAEINQVELTTFGILEVIFPQ